MRVLTEPSERKDTRQYDLVCFSHLRWDFVYQRPQHLMTRFGTERRVFYVEEPIYGDGKPRIEHSLRECGVHVAVPRLPHGSAEQQTTQLAMLMDEFFRRQKIHSYWLWYYTPMALRWTRQLSAVGVVYDCMDELSAFKNAPTELKELERGLMKRADLVFTGGFSLFEAKRHQHSNIYPFPSSIDAAHFAQARRGNGLDPEDQAGIGRPRLGFCGVIDERMDIELVRAVAEARPDWHWMMIGPVAKIDASDLPQRENIHYLGMKSYDELPRYIAGWDVAVLPFARNEATRFISPTKTPEYLAAGRPVVSTSIKDVMSPYGELGLVHVADEPHEFIAAVETAMHEDPRERLRNADALLSQSSWSRTWGRMTELMDDVVQRPSRVVATSSGFDVPNPASIPGTL